MLDIAQYIPVQGELIYHYCSAETLLAILQTGTLRLADVSEMNDALEREWGLGLLEEAIAARNGNVPPVVLQTIQLAMASARVESMCLASCFSTKGDLLSQWRAYATNGAGFAIGLDPYALKGLPVTLLKVCYNREKQIESVEDGLDAVLELYSELWASAAISPGEDPSSVAPSPTAGELTPGQHLRLEGFVRAAQFLAYDLVAFKSEAFEEESEVRVVHFAHVDSSNDHRVSLVSNGAPEAWPMGKEPELGFTMRNSVPICNVDIPIPSAAIKEIVIGPRATVSQAAMKRFLSTLGYSNTETSRSSASYR
jgi:hypothetical protein